MSRSINALSRRMLRLPVRDASGAFRAYRVAILKQINLASIQATGYAYLEEDGCWMDGTTFFEVPSSSATAAPAPQKSASTKPPPKSQPSPASPAPAANLSRAISRRAYARRFLKRRHPAPPPVIPAQAGIQHRTPRFPPTRE